MNTNEMTTERINEILNNLKIQTKILGFANEETSKMIVELELELAKRN